MDWDAIVSVLTIIMDHIGHRIWMSHVGKKFGACESTIHHPESYVW